MNAFTRNGMVLAAMLALSACTTLESAVSKPRVSLRDVAIDSVDLRKQTFVLNFDVSNPNPFPLPISTVSYGVELEGQRFASGEARCALIVPAQSDGSFEISVDLNLLETAPKLLFIVRDAARDAVDYELEGKLDLDIPMNPTVSFADSGSVRLLSPGY